jgi:hypothetical protein
VLIAPPKTYTNNNIITTGRMIAMSSASVLRMPWRTLRPIMAVVSLSAQRS